MTPHRKLPQTALLTGQRAVITGGASGIGAAIAMAFADHGAEVTVVDATPVNLNIHPAGGALRGIAADVLGDTVLAELAEQCPDIVVNNVGHFLRPPLQFAENSPELWDDLHAINLGHFLRVTHAFTQALPENLRHLPAHSRDMTVETHQELAARYDERYANYGYKPMTTKNRRTRFRGPVRADRATSPIRCPNTPYSMRGSQDRPTTTCAGRCGCSGTVTLPDSYLPNIRQRHPYGTTKWFKDYYRRNAVESANSQLRDAQPFERGYTRVFGRIKNALLLGFTIFAHNQSCIVNHFHLRRRNVPAQFPLTHRPLTPDTHAPAQPRTNTRRPRAPSG